MNSSAIPDPAPAQTASVARSWRAELQLRFARARSGHTTLRHARHRGPLRVQRTFHPDADGTAHCYLLHPPGGVVLGDELAIDVAVDSGKALLTTPSAGRFYGVGDFSEKQVQRVSLRAGAEATLWWLPQETILYNGARTELVTDIDLRGEAHLVWWDVVVLGHPASGERFSRGELQQRLHIRRDGHLLLEERVALTAGDRFTQSSMGLRGSSTFGSMVLDWVAPDGQLQEWLERVNGGAGTGEFSITQRGPLLLARYLGDDAARCRQGFSALWRVHSTEADGAEPSEPRIWHT